MHGYGNHELKYWIYSREAEDLSESRGVISALFSTGKREAL